MSSRTVVLVLGLSVGGLATLTAQSQARDHVTSNPFELILTKLNQIITTLTPRPGPVTLTTPVVRVANGDPVECLLANIGTETMASFQFRILSQTGFVLGGGIVVNLLPGQSGGGGAPCFGGVCRCEFMFEGTGAAVRANLLATAGGVTSISADAR